jgi:hypothetical protein
LWWGGFFLRQLYDLIERNVEKINLTEKNIRRRWLANTARFFQIWPKSEKFVRSQIWPFQTDPLKGQLFAKKGVK